MTTRQPTSTRRARRAENLAYLATRIQAVAVTMDGLAVTMQAYAGRSRLLAKHARELAGAARLMLTWASAVDRQRKRELSREEARSQEAPAR